MTLSNPNFYFWMMQWDLEFDYHLTNPWEVFGNLTFEDCLPLDLIVSNGLALEIAGSHCRRELDLIDVDEKGEIALIDCHHLDSAIMKISCGSIIHQKERHPPKMLRLRHVISLWKLIYRSK